MSDVNHYQSCAPPAPSQTIDAPDGMWHECTASMHIPDGFLDAKTAATTATMATGGLAVALRQVRRHLPPRRVPLLGLSAAFIFAAQLLNFPIMGGTSGHLIGGVLAAVLLGPAAAVIAMSCVLIVQCFLFADGGVTALGANILNMAIINPLIGYTVYRLTRAALPGTRGLIIAAAFASWCATVVTAIACAGQLAFAGTTDWALACPTMSHIHMVIGLGEGVITGLVLTALTRTRPELTESTSAPREFLGLGLLTALGLAVFVAPFTSVWPDGLEKVAHDLGFERHTAPLWLGLPANAMTGAIGVGLAFALSVLLARRLIPRPPDEAQLSGSP